MKKNKTYTICYMSLKNNVYYFIQDITRHEVNEWIRKYRPFKYKTNIEIYEVGSFTTYTLESWPYL